ncbi:hypothetical protein GBF38_004989 [Nibea albiflora]|uniref:Uncharacterized protein n=1 Tax=Nibea albiflora TaxID=240163 RepID=A0ACB7EVW9_NIBAL|nr:hypothetical protein GBF38_004989 [Nibea albiflora]
MASLTACARLTNDSAVTHTGRALMVSCSASMDPCRFLTASQSRDVTLTPKERLTMAPLKTKNICFLFLFLSVVPTLAEVLENEDDRNKNMMIGDRKKNYTNQAENTDYRRNRWFDRGHLFPSSHAFTKAAKNSTFTLTNIVPQARTFNQGSWNRMEKCIKCVMDEYCTNNNGVVEGFVVTGAQPSTNNILKNRINIPSMLWSAFCCYSFNMKTWISSAHWGDNVPDDPKHKRLQTKTLSELHEELKTDDSGFNVFPGTQCPLHTTATEFYPENKSCDLPTLHFNHICNNL